MKVTEKELTEIASQIQIKTFVGGYRLGDSNYYTIFSLTHKPNWFHRTMMRFFFGMIWVND